MLPDNLVEKQLLGRRPEVGDPTVVFCLPMIANSLTSFVHRRQLIVIILYSFIHHDYYVGLLRPKKTFNVV